MELCQRVKEFHEKLCLKKNSLDSLFASGLKEHKRKEFVRLGTSLKKGLQKTLAEWPKLRDDIEKVTQSDEAISRRLERIQSRLNVSLDVAVVNGFVYVARQSEEEVAEVFNAIVQPDLLVKRLSFRNFQMRRGDLEGLASVLKNPKNKIVELDLDGCMIGLNGLKILAEALKNPNNKVRILNMYDNGLGHLSVAVIKEILSAPNCKIEYLNLIGNPFAVRFNEEILAAARNTGRQIVVELDYVPKR